MSMIIYKEKKIFFLPCNVEKLRIWCRIHSENIIVRAVFSFTKFTINFSPLKIVEIVSFKNSLNRRLISLIFQVNQLLHLKIIISSADRAPTNFFYISYKFNNLDAPLTVRKIPRLNLNLSQSTCTSFSCRPKNEKQHKCL